MEALPMIFPQWEKWSAGLGGQTTKQTPRNKLIIERELLSRESLTLGVEVDFVVDSEVAFGFSTPGSNTLFYNV